MGDVKTGQDFDAWAYAIPLPPGAEYDHWVVPNWDEAHDIKVEQDAGLEEGEPEYVIVPLYPKEVRGGNPGPGQESDDA